MFSRITKKLIREVNIPQLTFIYVTIYKEWLVHSNKNEEGNCYHDFFIAYKLTYIVDKPTYVLDITGHHANLDFFLTSCLDKCSAKVLPPLGSSNYSLINVKIDTKPKVYPLMSYFIRIFWYSKADWDSFRFHIAGDLLSAFFKNRVHRTTSLISEFYIRQKVSVKTG